MLSYQNTVNHDLTERSLDAEDWENTEKINSLIQERLLSYPTNFSRNSMLDNLLYSNDRFVKCEGTEPRGGVFYDPNGKQIKTEECLDINRLLYDNSDESNVLANQVADDLDLNYFDHRKGADNNQFLYNKSINSSNISNCKNDYTKPNYTKSGCPSTATSASQSPTNVLTMDNANNEYHLMSATDISPENTIDGVNFFTDPFNYENVLSDDRLLFYTPDNSCGPVIDFTDSKNKKPSLTLNLKGTFVNPDEINTPNIIDSIMEASEQPLQFITDKDEIFNEVSYLTTSPHELTPCPSTSSPAGVSDTVEDFLSAVTSPMSHEPARKSIRPRKRRYDSDYEPNDDEDDDETYTPTTHRRRKSRDVRIPKKKIVYEDISEDEEDYKPPRKSNAVESRLKTVSDIENELLRIGKRGRPPKHLRSISSDDYSLLDPDEARYREMRDRNNEASRKSRYKRKRKEQQICDEHEDLEMENVKLKAQVEELQKTVDHYRDNLMKVMLSGKK